MFCSLIKLLLFVQPHCIVVIDQFYGSCSYDVAPMIVQDVVQEYPSPEQFFIEEGTGDENDDNWDGYFSYAGETDSGNGGGFDEDFYRDYYSL